MNTDQESALVLRKNDQGPTTFQPRFQQQNQTDMLRCAGQCSAGTVDQFRASVNTAGRLEPEVFVAPSTTRARMTALVQKWYTSEEPQGDFAARHGISRAKFRYWVWQLGQEPAPPVHFAPVQVVTGEGATGVVEIALPNGTRVLVREGAPAGLITQVLTALTAC